MTTMTRDRRSGELRVESAMHAGVHTCDRSMRLTEVAATMAREHIHCVVVESSSGGGRHPLQGARSDGRARRRAARVDRGREPELLGAIKAKALTAATAMTAPAVTVASSRSQRPPG